jgi:hypothetical protein
VRLLEAVIAGAARLPERCVGVYLTANGMGGCGIGAAYLGCHPDVSVGPGAASAVEDWLERNDVFDARDGSLRGWAFELASFNDDDRSGDFRPVARWLVDRGLASTELLP